MNRTLKVSLFIAGIFACGVVVGMFGERQFASPPPAQQPPVGRSPGGPAQEAFAPHILRRLTSELELTEAQRTAIEPIIKRAGDELRVLRQESMKQSGAVVEAMNTALMAELTPAQREKFTVLKEAQKARMKAAMEERMRRRESGERGDGRDPARRPRDEDAPRPPDGVPPSPPSTPAPAPES